jgi:hypothetical protein
MSDTYIIETRKEAAGIVVHDRCGFRFFTTHDFNHLEGRLFGSPKDAEAAAQRHIGERQGGTEPVAPERPSTAARNLTAPALAMDAKAISMSHIFKEHRRQVALHRGWQHDDDILPRHARALAYLDGGCDRGPRRDAAQYSLITRERSGGVEGCLA